MASVKAEMRRIADALPSGATWLDAERAMLQRRYDAAVARAEDGDFISQQQIEKDMARWIHESAGQKKRAVNSKKSSAISCISKM
jgi:hypothetical protein